MTSKPAARARHFDSLEQQVFLNLWRTYDRLRAFEDKLFGEFDLTPQQYNALRLLHAGHPEPVPTLALASRLVSRAPDITRLLDKLETRGYVFRDRPADNRRMVRIGITPKGTALLAMLQSRVRDCHTRQLGHLPPRSMRTLVRLLRAARQPHEDPDGTWL